MQGSLATRLRVLRAQQGLTLRQAAKKLEVTPGTLSELERGVRHPHDVTLSRIAKGYEIPVEELLEDSPKAEAPTSSTSDEDEDRRADLLELAADVAAANLANEESRRDSLESAHEARIADEERRIQRAFHSWRDYLSSLAERWEQETEQKDYDPRWMLQIAETLKDARAAVLNNKVISNSRDFDTQQEYEASWAVDDALTNLEDAVEAAWRSQQKKYDELVARTNDENELGRLRAEKEDAGKRIEAGSHQGTQRRHRAG